MITITSVIGNIRSDKKFNDIYLKLDRESKVERILLPRMEAQRSIIRRSSDAGTDIAIKLQHGTTLKHGDVLFTDESKLIVVEYLPEDALGFKIKKELSNDERVSVAVKLGHIIGNLHRPIFAIDNVTYMPIQSESEVANIRRNLAPIIACIDIIHAKIIFETEEGIEVHTH